MSRHGRSVVSWPKNFTKLGSLSLALMRWFPDQRAALLHLSGMTRCGFVGNSPSVQKRLFTKPDFDFCRFAYAAEPFGSGWKMLSTTR